MFASAIKKHRIKTTLGVTAVACGLAAGITLGTAADPDPVEAASTKALKSTKNVILMISDGWGYSQIAATDYYEDGKLGTQVYEKFPTRLGMSTYMVPGEYDTEQAWADFNYVKSGATDSAAAATAMSTGEKTYDGSIGMALDREPLKHAAEYAEEMGKATGVITSVEFSHATPAGFVAHNVSRNNYAEIANEMIYESATDVIMGCGAPDYDDNGKPASKTTKYVGGATTWADITDDMEVIGASSGSGTNDWTVIRDRAEFQAMAEGETVDRVLGIPYVYQTLQYNRSGDLNAAPYADALIETVPTLEEMTEAALNVLDNDEDGFFLMVEGGAVDWAGHGNSSGRMIEEQVDFNNSVEAVVEWVQENSNWGETLVIVTGDHECGYLTGADGDFGDIKSAAGDDVLDGMYWNSGSHTNSIIPFFAKGDASRFFKWVADEQDLVRGRYLDNTELGNILIQTLQ